jgi:hypothetical protein
LGKVVWTHRPVYGNEANQERLSDLLSEGRPHIVFADDKVRLKSNSPLWRDGSLHLVVLVENWKGIPPHDGWTCLVRNFSHQRLGGVTNGDYKIYIALRNGTPHELQFSQRIAAKTRLSHVLDAVPPGSRCPIPLIGAPPLGQDRDGMLHWNRRLHTIEAPTVFTKLFWVKRKLTIKELCSVLDLPSSEASRPNTKEWIGDISMPGKVRARVVEAIRKWTSRAKGPAKRLYVSSMAQVTSHKKPCVSPLDSMQEAPCDITSYSAKEAVLGNLTVTIKSTKADDAHVPTHLWDNRVLAYAGIQELPHEQVLKALGTLRDKFLLPLWKRIVARIFRKWVLEMDKVGWWQEATERTTSLRAGAKALAYAVGAMWWEWDHGSFPFFWRWPSEFVREIRDGMPPRFLHDTPACMERQRPNANPLFAEKERSKVFKVIKKGYLRPVHRSELKSLMHYFSVPKGENDIRMVYDGSKCLLNAATFAPWFAVPTSSTLERTVLPHTIQGANNFGDMFLNFQLHKEMQKYTGVDAWDLLNNVEAKTWLQRTSFSWEEETLFTWDRPAMGLTGSPYQAV